ncbi:hypothetical protein D9M73_267620 [compost metagenome]
MVAARQLDGFAYCRLVGAATLVGFFFAVDAHHFGGWQLGHFRAGGGFLAGVAEPAFDFDFEAAGAGEGQQVEVLLDEELDGERGAFEVAHGVLLNTR